MKEKTKLAEQENNSSQAVEQIMIQFGHRFKFKSLDIALFIKEMLISELKELQDAQFFDEYLQNRIKYLEEK